MNSNSNAETDTVDQQEICVSSPDSIVSVLKDLEEGESVIISVKRGSLQSEWNNAIATKGPKDFIIKYDDISLDDEVCPFDDESRSLLSENLWQIGWFQFRGRQDKIQRNTTTVPDEMTDIKEVDSNFVFGGVKFPNLVFINGAGFNLWNSVTVTTKGEERNTIAAKTNISVHGKGPSLFFFAAESTEISNSGHKAIIFDSTLSQPAVVELLDVIPVAGESEVCVDEACSKVKQFLKTLTTTNGKERKLDGPPILVEQEQLKKVCKVNERKRRHVQPRTFSPEKYEGTKKDLQTASGKKKCSIFKVDNEQTKHTEEEGKKTKQLCS